MEKTSTKQKHKDWRRSAKKERRKRIRQQLAKERDELNAEIEEKKLKDPDYVNSIKREEALELVRKEQEIHERIENEKKWLHREQLAQEQFVKDTQIKREIEAQNAAAKNELEKAIEDDIEVKKKTREESRRQHEHFLERIQKYIKDEGDLPEELLKSTSTNPDKEICNFFTKTAACRYGDRCSRNHIRPGVSKLVLMRNFFRNFHLEKIRQTEYGEDINLEYTEEDIHDEFLTFYNDVIPEMLNFGNVQNFKVCNNTQAHLRGNVYVEFQTIRGALKAYLKLQGRYYAKRKIQIEFCSLVSWMTAICGKHFLRRCSKGRNCNYLHVFRNPANKYNNFQSNVAAIQIKNDKIPEKITWETEEGDKTSDKRNWRWSESPEKDMTKNSPKEKKDSRYHRKQKESKRSKSKDSTTADSSSSIDRSRKRSSSSSRYKSKSKHNKSSRSKSRIEKKLQKSRRSLSNDGKSGKTD